MTQTSKAPAPRKPMEHENLWDAAGPHCRCGWIPRSGRGSAVNRHITLMLKKARGE